MRLYWLLALAVSTTAGYCLPHVVGTLPTADLRNAVNVVAGASATLLGFLVSAGALLYAVANTALVRNLQRTGHFGALLVDLFVDAALFFLALIVGLAALFVPSESGAVSDPLWWAMRLLVALNCLAYLLLAPVGLKMWWLLTSLSPDRDALE